MEVSRMKRSFVVLLVLAVFVASCSGPAMPAPRNPLNELGEKFQVSLPRLTVKIAEDGTPSILGISPAILKFAGVDPEAFKLPADTVKRLSEANVQHIEIAVVDGGLRIWVNGESLPFIQTDSDSLGRAVALLGALDVGAAPMLQRVLPIITRLGLDVVLRFPVQSGAAEIPLTVVGDARAPALAPLTDPASVVARMEVKYDEQGKPSIMGIDASQAMGQVLSPETIAKLQSQNIQTLEFRNRPSGMTIYVNGEPLPTLQWDTALLSNATDLIAQVLPADSAVAPLVEAFLPTMDRADINIMVHLPLAPGAEPLRVQMHE
jgi:hypothetical protein